VRKRFMHRRNQHLRRLKCLINAFVILSMSIIVTNLRNVEKALSPERETDWLRRRNLLRSSETLKLSL